MVDGLQKDYEGEVEFKLYDVDKSEEGQALAQKYGAQYVPTFVFVNSDGTTSDQVVGAVDESVMIEKLDALH